MKKCKGTGKAKGYGCNEPLPYTERNSIKSYKAKYGLGYDCKCYQNWLLSTDTGKEIIKKTTIKATESRRNLKEAEKEYKNEKKLSYLIQNTVNACHSYIKLRDKGKPCISCGENYHSDFQAGHFYKAELYSTLKFDETNIHGQCKGCNLYKDGNESSYRVGLIKRYSKGYLDLLDSKSLLDKKKPFKWDRNELKRIYNYYKNKIKTL